MGTAPDYAQALTHEAAQATKGNTANSAVLADPTDDVEWWSEAQLNWRFKPKFRLTLAGALRRGQVNDAFINKQLGIGFGWTFHKNLSFATQYRHIISTPVPSRRSIEERVYVELTPRTDLRAGFVFSDRNRFDWRWINGALSKRYRNRLQLERPFALAFNGHERQFTPYFYYEAYYDSRYKSLARHQIFGGARLPLAPHITFKGYYMRQLDGHARPGYLHVIGTFLQFDF